MDSAQHTPTVVISNFAEAHFDFLNRASTAEERAELIGLEAFHGDRTLLWAGDPKLVIVSYPIAHADWLTERLGYPGTRHLSPRQPTPWLCQDILRERSLLQAIADYAGPGRTVQLIPYATTPEFLELVDTLRRDFALQVLTPESPDRDHLWVRDYMDTKAGFRLLASTWLAEAQRLLPFGVVCENAEQAAEVAHWFCRRGQSCVAKPNTGESGVGVLVIKPSQCAQVCDVVPQLQQNPFYTDEPIIVERYIHSPQQISPSPEVLVPPLGQGEPRLMSHTRQVFLKFGDFCGVEICPGEEAQPWYPDLMHSALTIGKGLQEMGYVGYFDMDCIVGEDGQLYLLEVNTRRTGGTHAHEFARYYFGEDYTQQVTIISYEANPAGSLRSAEQLLHTLDDLLFPIHGQPRGVIPTITNALHLGRFGAIYVAPSTAEALQLQQQTWQRTRSA